MPQGHWSGNGNQCKEGRERNICICYLGNSKSGTNRSGRIGTLISLVANIFIFRLEVGVSLNVGNGKYDTNAGLSNRLRNFRAAEQWTYFSSPNLRVSATSSWPGISSICARFASSSSNFTWHPDSQTIRPAPRSSAGTRVILRRSWPLSHTAAPLAVFVREGCPLHSTLEIVEKKIQRNIQAPLPSRLAEPEKALIAGVTVIARGAANAETRMPDTRRDRKAMRETWQRERRADMVTRGGEVW